MTEENIVTPPRFKNGYLLRYAWNKGQASLLTSFYVTTICILCSNVPLREAHWFKDWLPELLNEFAVVRSTLLAPFLMLIGVCALFHDGEVGGWLKSYGAKPLADTAVSITGLATGACVATTLLAWRTPELKENWVLFGVAAGVYFALHCICLAILWCCSRVGNRWAWRLRLAKRYVFVAGVILFVVGFMQFVRLWISAEASENAKALSTGCEKVCPNTRQESGALAPGPGGTP